MRSVGMSALSAFFSRGFVLALVNGKKNENLLSKYQTVLGTFAAQKYQEEFTF